MLDLADERSRMIAETCAFIEWGLAHPEQVRWIPCKRVGDGGFSRRMQVVFWCGVFVTAGTASRDLAGQLLRWIFPG